MKIIRKLTENNQYAVVCQSYDDLFNNPTHEFYAAFYWCKDTFGYEPNRMKFWPDNYNFFWFETKEHRDWFILRWCE